MVIIRGVIHHSQCQLCDIHRTKFNKCPHAFPHVKTRVPIYMSITCVPENMMTVQMICIFIFILAKIEKEDCQPKCNTLVYIYI